MPTTEQPERRPPLVPEDLIPAGESCICTLAGGNAICAGLVRALADIDCAGPDAPEDERFGPGPCSIRSWHIFRGEGEEGVGSSNRVFSVVVTVF